MRAISLVKHLEFEFSGNVLRNAITLHDVDNDGNSELIVGNERGEVTIFKGYEKWQTISNLGFVCCLAVGDIFNENRNCLVIVTGDGWCYIYGNSAQDEINEDETSIHNSVDDSVDVVDGQILSGESEVQTSDSSHSKPFEKKHGLQQLHVQRIPANTKYILLDDIDDDGSVEMVLGLTDRVVRSYRWYNPRKFLASTIGKRSSVADELCSKLVGLNKWECAKQIGSVTLHHDAENKPTLLIAQPGGTFMRIRYTNDDKLEQSDSSTSISEYLTGSSIDYQFLGLSRMRNQNISTEIIGDLKVLPQDDNKRGAPYAVATLDGTIMLVQEEIILWAIAVDHQIFALTKLDVTGNGIDDLVACSWDGHTYILDQEKNVVRFQQGESVQAFASGYYTLVPGEKPVTCFVYVTFHNKILVYHDICLKDMSSRNFSVSPDCISDVLQGTDANEKASLAHSLDEHDKRSIVEYLLYGVGS